MGLVAIVTLVVIELALRLAPQLEARASGAPRFVEEARAAGIVHAYEGGSDYLVGGGVAVFDCNSDNRPELFIAGGSAPSALFINDSQPGGALHFELRSSAATALVAVTGAYPVDFDSDGLTDLAILRRGADILLRGLGDCSFESANQAWQFDGGDLWSTAFSARWDSGASWPTIALGHYLEPASTGGLRPCSDNQLVLPDAAGEGFTTPVPLSPGWCTLSMLFSDWDRSGRRDLRVTNDRHYYADTSAGEEQLWRVPEDGSASLYTAADGWQPLRVWGMGIASYDVTGDGYPEYYLTSQGDNKLQTLADGSGQPRYEDIALVRGATATRPYAGDTSLPSTAWHDEFADVNNDGYVDLFVAKGNVEAMPDFAARDPSDLLIGQSDGTFLEGADEAGLADFARTRGAALADLNADGMLDLVVVVRQENVRLWRNVGLGSADAPTLIGNWLEVRLEEPAPNVDAIGAWVEVRVGDRTQLREVTVGGGHVSGQLGMFHFGLGTAESADVRVIWPDAEIGPWQKVTANQRVLVERGATTAVALP
ncbi:MAG: enediyne biosynthesis protein [Chloroflexota bacterium]|jgi:hypothetical protein|nr:enediyne biosynthesis protein [Chloroflexota bacterium]